jgi:hypothetical protein
VFSSRLSVFRFLLSVFSSRDVPFAAGHATQDDTHPQLFQGTADRLLHEPGRKLGDEVFGAAPREVGTLTSMPSLTLSPRMTFWPAGFRPSVTAMLWILP